MQGLQLLVGCGDAGVGVSLLLLALLIGVDLVEVARSVEVEIGVEIFEAILVDSLGVLLGDVCVSEMLADDGTVFRLHEGIVVALARSGFCELDEKLVKEFSDDPVDELRAVVGVESKDFERKLLDQAFQERNKMSFVDPLDATDLRYWMTRVIPDGYPEGFSNPFKQNY